ncbi:TY5A, partial [Symbiodinium sp. KB8]
MAAFFDEDLRFGLSEDETDQEDFEEGAVGAEAGDSGERHAPGAGAASKEGDEPEGSVGTLSGSAGNKRRKRGCRGGAKTGSLGDVDNAKRWRSGAVPAAPTFEGDVESNPYCLRHYRRRLMRWVRITKEFLPPNEQALRALEQLRGAAEQEFEEVDDARFDHPDGISRLLSDLEVSFGEKEIFRQGGSIREFESIGRMQGESITAFVRRFRLLERKLADHKVPPYPEAARVSKLLDGLRLDDKSTSALLLAAGNRYNMQAIQDAIKIQYPAGMSVTGVPKGLASLSSGARSTTSSRSSASTRSSTTSSTRRGRPGPPRHGGRWSQWHTYAEETEEYEDDNGQDWKDWPNDDDATPGVIPEEPAGDDGQDYNLDDAEADVVPEDQNDDYDLGDDNVPDEYEALISAVNALTVTSKKLANVAQARGYYPVDQKGKGKKGSPFKKGKGRGKSKGKPSVKGAGAPPGKGKGRGSSWDPQKQARFQGALCLGCGSPDHWIKVEDEIAEDEGVFRAIMVHLIEFMVSVQNTVLHYAAISLRPRLKDSILRIFTIPSTASTMLSTPAAMAAQRALGQDKYMKDPENCPHPSGLRSYSASGMKIMICDVCGYRAVVNPHTGAHLPAAPKASPGAKTPLNLSATAKAKVLPGKAKGPPPAPPSTMSPDSSLRSSVSSRGYGPSRAAGPKPKARPKSRMPGTEYFEMGSDTGGISRQWRATSRAGSDSERMSVTSEPQPDPPFPTWRDQRRYMRQQTEAALGPDRVSRLLNLEAEDWELNDWEQDIEEAEETGEADLQFDDEVHAGPFELSNKALASKMKVLRPSGMFPKDKEHLLRLREIILKWKPFLVVWVLPGHVSSSVLEALSRLLAELQLHDVHYLLGGLDLLSVEQRSCFFGSGSFPPLRAGCVTDLVELQGILETDQVLGSHSPRPLPCGPGALIQGLCEALCRAGDERFCTSSRAWACSIDQWDLWRPSCSLGPNFRAYFLDVTRHEDSWRPLLREAEARLRDLVSTTVTLKSSPYLEQIKALVPWELRRVQICRTPKQRRAPTDLIADGVKHRGASLLMNDGNIVIEAEAMKSVVNAPNTRYDKPVQIGIFFYGTAPDTSLNEEENLRPEPPRPTGQVRQDSIEPNDIMQPHQAGYRDISFPGATDLPRWMANVLRQLHTNLGHPAKEILVRQLVLAGASPQAVKGARCLQCKVCRRVQPPREPRPARAFYPRRFNDRLYMDIVFLKDIQGTVYSYLSCVDDATCYHAAQYLPDRQEMTVLRVFLSGWLTFFGPPDELVLDAEGAFKGLRFETLQVQTGTKLRYVPADAHWQLGRAERHGQALRYVCSRLVSQFAPTTVQEMNLCVTMAIHAKNTLIRRAGSSPCQWVFGRNPKLPASLLSDGGSIEACQLTSDSDRLQLVERIRTEAMVQHHRFEADQGLRTALLRKSRPHRGHLDVGQKVAYYRAKNSFDGEGSVEGYRQGTILALDEGVTGNVWVKNNRGRIVQVAREQCRPVAGEEEWWSPDQLDLQLLKNSDQDLLPAEVPGFSALRARPPNDAAVLRDRQGQVEQQPGPLDADGNPVASPAMMNPVLLVPPTPRAARAAPSTPTIPATPSSSAAPLQNPAMPTARSATIEPSLPALQAVPEDTALVPLPEPTPLASESPLESRRASGSVVGQDASSTPLASESHLESRRASGSVLGAGLGRGGRQSSSESSTGLSKELTKLLHQEYPEFRGIKRGPSVSVEDLSEGPNASRRTPQGPTTSEMTVIPDQLMDNVNPEPPLATFLLFCQDCGDQNRRLDHGTDVCARCNSARKVESPLQVSSWFDEVQERDALDRHFKVVKPEATGTETEPGAQRHEQEDFRATSFSTTCTTSPTSFNPEPLRRLDVLHRHARGDQRLPGWDGSPNEVHLYQSCNFLTAAHHFGDHRDKRQLRPPRAPSLSETTARKLLEAGDFRHSSCHQLLDTVKFTGSSRDCLYNNDGSSAQTLVLGLYSHGSFSGCTRATKHNKWLCRYLNDYLRSWGQWGTTTSLSISRNSGALPHRDVHNAKGSLNWLVSFGSHKGGRTWVETDRADAHTVNKIHKGNTYPGYVVDSRHNLVSFAPDRLHSTEPFTGDRWSLTAYTSRSVSYATEADKAKLDRLGFTPRMRRSTAFPVDYVQANDSEDNIDAKDGRGPQPAWVHQPVYKAYPTYASAKNADYVEGTPEQEYHIGIEQSSEDGDDGTFEASRAARQAEKKELPWRSMSATEVPAFREALRAEWAEWTKWRKPDNERPEPIFMRPPTDPVAIGAIPEWNSEQLLFKLSAPVYGQSNAPRRWYLHVADKLSGLGWVRHTLDPCLWMRLSPDTTAVCSVLGLHVDDVILATLPGTEDHLHEVEKAFEWGGPWEHSDFTFIGRRIKQHEDGSLTVDQANYVAEVPPTKITLDPETPLGDHPDLITEYRSGIGSLQWLASTTRADVAADVSLIQKAPSDLKVQDLMEINSVLRYIRATNEAGYKVMPIDLNELVFVAYADSGFANAPGHRSQGGLVIVATDKKVLTESRPASLLEWKSFRHQRVLRSTLAAEAASLDRSVDHAFFLASMFSELTDGNFKSTAQERPLYEVLPVTDVRSLWDAIHRLSTNFQEKRVEIDIAGLRQSCRTLRWVPTEEQKADALTKRSRLLRDSFRMFMANPVVTLVQSRSPEEMAGEKANAAWRSSGSSGVCAKATLQRCGMSQYVLTENGARAVRIADSMPVWEMWLEGSDVSATLSRIKAALPSARFAQLTSVGGLVEADATRAAAEKIFPKAVPDVVAELKTGYRCAKTYVHIPGSDDFSTTMGLVKEAAGTGWEVREIKQLLPSMSRTCEVQSSTVNKADGLRELCQAIGVPMQHVWAFGDDANDARMLSEVGWGVRMANHLPVLAGLGQDVTDFTNE